MSVPSTAEQFLELVSKSGLLDPRQFQAYLERRRAGGALPEAPGALAESMVRDGLLTRFQAGQLLQGKWRNFILSGKYKVLEALGSGGMGHVFLCEHLIMRRRVAVKVLPSRSGDSLSLERFHREARAVAQLKHINIVGGYDIDRDGPRHFLVMEYIDGSTFQTIVKERGALTPLRAAHYIRQAALGLQHAHEAGLVHRDIKPSNLLLDRAGTVKILDLGLARFFHDESDDLSKRHGKSPVGTMGYMAPEQALDSHQADIRADIYSLGATFYFLLAGHGPFQDGTVLQKWICHQFERPRPIRDVLPDLPEGLAAVLDRMMAKEPAERYQIPAEVAEALVPWTKTPIPPPPPEEMPELLSPARGNMDASPGPRSPTSPCEPAALPTPTPAREAETAPSPSSQPLSEPSWSMAEEGDFRVAAMSGMAREAPTATQPISPSPAASQEARRSANPTPSPGKASISPRPPGYAALGRRRAWPVVAALALLVLGAGIVGFALFLRNGGKGSPSTAGQQEPLPVVGADASPRLRLLVPAYFYPAGESLAQWERLLEAPDPAAVVIIANPDSGPGKRADPNYVRIIERARQKGITVIGYVPTRYAARAPQEVKEDIDRWILFYPGVRGIFFDEQTSKADRILYYADLYRYARKERRLTLVVNNPGTTCAEEYLARPAADLVCLVESGKDFNAFDPPAWASDYEATRFAGTIFKNDDPAKMKQYVRRMIAKRVGYCYITDAKLPNPWSRLPRYWDEEVQAVQQVNAE